MVMNHTHKNASSNSAGKYTNFEAGCKHMRPAGWTLTVGRYGTLDWTAVGDEVAGVSNRSVMKFRVSDGIKPNHWSAGVTDTCNNLVLVQLLTPPTTVIGRARLSIDTVRRETASDIASSTLSMSLADEYDVITGGYDVKELEVFELLALIDFRRLTSD